MIVNQETDFLKEVAERYEGEGYQVFREPPSSRLPKSLRQYHPDLLALRGKERIVVEIKKTSSPLALERLSKLKRSVEAIPGWKLDVVWFGDNASRAMSVRQALSDSEIRRRLKQIPAGKTKQAHEAELMALWACLEAAVRNRLSVVGEDERSPIPPSSLVRKAISFGFLPQSELKFLDELSRTRNQVAHGFQVRKQLPTRLKRLRRMIMRILAATEH